MTKPAGSMNPAGFAVDASGERHEENVMDQNSRFLSVSLEKTWATLPAKEKWTVSPIS